MRFVKPVATLALLSLLSACSWFGGGDKDDDEVAPDVPAAELYQQAMDDIAEGSFQEASTNLELIESRYPFGQYSQQSQLELIYTYYRGHDPDKAIDAADRFIRLHPNHTNIDYAYYMKGLAYFKKGNSILTQYLPLDRTKRDPGAALNAFDCFDTIIKQYPNSRYAADAQKRMQYLKNLLATHEIHVARYYAKRGAWMAAINRGRYVVEHYQETPAVADALAVMIEGYDRLGMDSLAASSRKVLKLNFPDYTYKPVDKAQPSLLNTATFGLLGSRDVSTPDIIEKVDEPAVKAPVITDDEIKVETSAESTDDDQADTDDDDEDRSWFSILTFGIFD